MSREELSSKYKKYTTTSNESMNKMETGPIKTNQSLNSSSYEYFSQKITTKNNITESSVNSLNQNTNSKYMQSNIITSGPKCTCNNNQKSELKCICPQGVHNAKCICGLYGKNLLEKNKITSSNSKMNNELKINEEMSGKKICNCSKGKEKQIEITSKINVNSITNANTKENTNANININLNSKNAKICNCNKGGIHTNINQTQSQSQTQICNCNKGAIHSSNINQAQVCNCNKGTVHTTNINQTQAQTQIQNQNKNQISSVRKVENYSYLSSNKNTSSDINTRITQKTTITKTKININKNISKADWNKRCVDQNNENLQIIAPEKPQLIAQCVQEMQVIQKPMPVQILLPIEYNEIDYPLGLEIYGKKKEEKKVLICPENIENLNVSKAYSTIVPQFENLNISKTEDVFCERTVTEKKEEIVEEEEEEVEEKVEEVEEKVEEVEEKVEEVEEKVEEVEEKVEEVEEVEEKEEEEEEPKEVMVDNNLKEKRYDNILISKNSEIAVKGKIFDFNKDNKAEVVTNMNVVGKNKISWNDTNEGIKTTKLNIETEGGFSIDKFDFFLNKSVFGKFDNLHIENNNYNYEGIPPKKKYSSSEANIETNDEIEYPAEYTPSNWNEIAEPMTRKPFTIRTEKNWPLSTTKGDKLTLKYAYRTKDWNKLIKTRREVQINMAIRKRKKGALSKQRVQPVIIKGTNKNNWNDIIKKQKESNIKIDKTEKEDNNFTFAKGDEVYIENQSDEILVNDDYNIVEQNYARPIRANIHKVQEYSEEESKSSDYNVLNGIDKYQGQIIYKDLINQSLKIQKQKVIINDISGKYPRKTETFQGLDEHYEKYANDQYQRNRNVRINIKKSAKTENINKYYVENKIIKREIKTQTIEQGQQPKVVIQSQVRKITYEPEHEDEYEHEHEQQKIQIQENYYQKQESHSSEQNNNINNDNNNINNNIEPEDEQEEEQENMDAPEDEDHIPEEKIAQNQQIIIKREEDEDNNQEQEDEHEHEHEQDIEEQYHEGENEEHEAEAEAEAEGEGELENEEEHNKYSAKHQIETQEQYYYLKKSEEKISNEQEKEQDNMNEQEHEQIEEEEVKDSLQKSGEIMEQKKESAEKEEPKIYIKEITFTKTEESPEENGVKLRYITLKKKEEQEDSNSQPNDQVQEDIKNEEQEIEKKEENIEQQNEGEENIVAEKEIKEENIEKGQSAENIQQQYITMQSQKVEEQHISKSENDIQSDLDKEIVNKEEKVENEEHEEKVELQDNEEKVELQDNEGKVEMTENIQQQYITMQSQKVEEQHISKSENDIKSDLDKEVDKYEEEEKLKQIREKELSNQEIPQDEEYHEEHEVKDNIQNEEEVDNEIEEEIKRKQEILEKEKNMQENIQIEGQAEEHFEEHGEEHSEAHAEQHSKENMEEHVEENMEENIEQQEKENIEITQDNQENEQIQKEEIQRENEVQNNININQKENTISNIVANAIKVEMQAQEAKAKEESESKAKRIISIHQRQRQEQEQNSNSIQHSEMVDKYSKYIRENPIIAHGQNTINIMSKVSGKEAQTQKVTLSQVISPEKQTTQNQITQTIIVQENTNPMMYSFGQGSIEGSNLSSSKKKSSNIIISGSMTNNNMLKGSNITFAPKGLSSTQYIMNSGISSTSGNNLISSGQNITETKMIYSSKSNMQRNAGNLSGKYYFTTSHNTTTTTRVVNKKKEPMDTDKRRRRMIEREMKAEYEIDSLDNGPRDSKRK